MQGLIIWDFRNTIYNTDTKKLEDNAKEVLEHFHKTHSQVLISSTPEQEERINLVVSLDIDKYFNDIYVGPKSADVFEHFLDKYKNIDGDIYVVGDNFSSEIIIGNALKLKTIWFKHGNPDEKKMNIEYWKKISDLKELISIIK